VNYELEVKMKEALLAYFELPSPDLPMRTSNNHEKPQSISPAQGYEVLKDRLILM
jgi:hypothetical protein